MAQSGWFHGLDATWRIIWGDKTGPQSELINHLEPRYKDHKMHEWQKVQIHELNKIGLSSGVYG